MSESDNQPADGNDAVLDELDAMSRIQLALARLSPTAAQRVIAWAESLTNERLEAEYDQRFSTTDSDLEW